MAAAASPSLLGSPPPAGESRGDIVYPPMGSLVVAQQCVAFRFSVFQLSRALGDFRPSEPW